MKGKLGEVWHLTCEGVIYTLFSSNRHKRMMFGFMLSFICSHFERATMPFFNPEFLVQHLFKPIRMWDFITTHEMGEWDIKREIGST